MPTLFLSAPKGKAQAGTHRKDFSTILPWMKAVVFDRDGRRQADGFVLNCTPTSKTGNNIQRYDVHLGNLREVSYTTLCELTDAASQSDEAKRS
jgi:hypothetical protein